MYNEFETVKTLNSSKEVFFRIDKRTSLNNLQISPDSSRLAYLAQKGKNVLLVLDDKVVAEHPGIGIPSFSPNGKHYAYSIYSGDKFSVCFDDIEGPSYDDGDFRIVFSPDSNRFSYRVSRGKKQLVVIDGKESQEYDGTGENSLAFSPNSQRFAYAARDGKNWFLVENGEKGQDYKVLSNEGVVFSPDSEHYAYTAAVEGEGFVVVDGKEGWHYDDVLPKRPIFSPDSTRIAYWASINAYSTNNRAKLSAPGPSNSVFLVVDEEEGFCSGKGGEISFAPNSQDVFFQAGNYGFLDIKYFRGMQEPKDQIAAAHSYDSIDNMVFTPDGKRLLYVISNEGQKAVYIIHGFKENSQKGEFPSMYLNTNNCEYWSDIIPAQGNVFLKLHSQNKFQYIAHSKPDNVLYAVNVTME